MDKLSMVYDMMVDQRESINKLSNRIENIERNISELKEFKAKLTGICLTISTAIGLIPSLLRYLQA